MPSPRSTRSRRSATRRVGVNILRRALEEPLRQIATNAGQEGSVVVDAVRKMKPGHGYDAQKGEYTDMFEGRHHRPGEGDALGAGERRLASRRCS